MLLERTSQACYKYMAIFGELVPSWLYSQLQVIDPISGVVRVVGRVKFVYLLSILLFG